MSSKKIMEVLDAAAKMEVKVVDWLGGDPLVRPDWYSLCRYAMKLGLINNIWTSGIPLSNMDTAHRAVEVTTNGFFPFTSIQLNRHTMPCPWKWQRACRLGQY